MVIRRPILAEILMQGALVVLLVLLAWDLIVALEASACSAPPIERTPDCYPWGMTEGPMVGAGWQYQGKANYLRENSVLAIILAIGALTPFFTRDWRLGVAVAWFAVPTGWLCSEWIARLI